MVHAQMMFAKTAPLHPQRRNGLMTALTTALSSLLSAVLLVMMLGAAQAQDAAADSTGEAGAAASEERSVELQLLIDTLRDDAARNRLLDELEAASGELEPGPVATIDDALFGTAEMSLGRRIAETTRYFAESAAQSAAGFWGQLSNAPRTFSALDTDQMSVLFASLRDLALVIIATYAIFVTLRMLAKRAFRRMGARAHGAPLLQKAVLIIVSALLDIAVVVAAWAAGYLIALTLFGELGTIGLRQTLYLNAFLIVELFKVMLRIVLSPSAPELRLIAISTIAAQYLNRWLTVIVTIMGYGQLLVLPIFNQDVSLAAGQAISALISVIAVVIAMALVVVNRQAVTAWLLDTPEGQPRHRQVRFLARRWHWAALAYLVFLLVIVIASPTNVLLPVLAASGQIVLALIIGLAVAHWIAASIARGISLPDRVNHRLPLLERRLNTFVPKFLTVLRFVIFACVLAFVLHTVGLIDMRGWMETQIGIRMTAALISVAFILVFAFAAWLALTSWVDYRLNPDYGSIATSREQTLLSLLRNAATIVLIVITLMFSLSQLGIDIAPLLASAGVLGLAIGFGAQKLVQDIITGIFIQLENAINVGDVITVGGMTGTVERLTIRSVSLRDVHGSYHIIPFSSVDMVTNFMRDFAYHVADMGIAYREDTDDAKTAMFDAFEELRADPDIRPAIIGDLEWFGVQALGDSAVTVRGRIKTVPGKQWAVGRAFNTVLKKVFDARGIEIPFPHQTIYFGENKDGSAPLAHIAVEALPKRAAAGGRDVTSTSKDKRRENAAADLPFDHEDTDAGEDQA
jgi:moderate conductance mechanosensitive channel